MKFSVALLSQLVLFANEALTKEALKINLSNTCLNQRAYQA